MKTLEIKYGGVLQTGDFIGVGSNHSMFFGWYVEKDKPSIIEFISPENVIKARDNLKLRIELREAKGKEPLDSDANGLTLNHIKREYVRTLGFSRVVRIHEPNLIFQDEDKDEYRLAKKILEELKFL
jgi:hypothetical protein